jgi:hypothetical protein
VADNGLPLGTSGAIQHDPRFGDIRIAGEAMSSGILATGAPFDPLSGTWSGDIVFNTSQPIGPGGLDLYTVALHEIGHALGLPENPDPSSVMYEGYQGPRQGLSGGDVGNIQALYGPRLADSYDLKASNDSPAGATHLNVPSGGPATFTADLTTPYDTDFYQIQLPGNVTEATIRLHVAGLSLLAGRLTISGVNGAEATATGPGQDLELSLSSLPAGHSLLVRVDSLSPNFSIGAYQLEVIPLTNLGQPDHQNTPASPGASSSGQPPVINLQPRVYRTDQRFAYYTEDSVSAGVSKTYRFLAPANLANDPAPLTILAWSLQPGSFRPHLTLLNDQGVPVPATVLVNEGGTYVLQVANPSPGTSYLLRVDGNGLAGNYALGILFDGQPAVPTPLVTDGLMSPASDVAATLNVAEPQLMHFIFAANGSPGATFNLVDAQGQLVASLVAPGAEPVTTSLYLPAGAYTISLIGAGQGSVWAVALSSPLGPEASDVTQVPQPLPSSTTQLGFQSGPGGPVSDPTLVAPVSSSITSSSGPAGSLNASIAPIAALD